MTTATLAGHLARATGGYVAGYCQNGEYGFETAAKELTNWRAYLPELLARIAALESVDKAARAYANAYLVDEAADPELTGCPPEQNAAAVALFDALEFAKESTDGR